MEEFHSCKEEVKVIKQVEYVSSEEEEEVGIETTQKEVEMKVGVEGAE